MALRNFSTAWSLSVSPAQDNPSVPIQQYLKPLGMPCLIFWNSRRSLHPWLVLENTDRPAKIQVSSQVKASERTLPLWLSWVTEWLSSCSKRSCRCWNITLHEGWRGYHKQGLILTLYWVKINTSQPLSCWVPCGEHGKSWLAVPFPKLPLT